jgi:hypothetical protein
MVDLRKCTDINIPKQDAADFQIVSPERTYYLAANSSEEARVWCSKLKQLIPIEKSQPKLQQNPVLEEKPPLPPAETQPPKAQSSSYFSFFQSFLFSTPSEPIPEPKVEEKKPTRELTSIRSQDLGLHRRLSLETVSEIEFFSFLFFSFFFLEFPIFC